MRKWFFILTFLATIFVGSGSEAISIDQGLFSLRLMPGESVTKTITITNTDTIERTYRLVLQDFTATDESGTPTFISESEPRLTSTLDGWITWSENTLKLIAGESREVAFTIHVPAEAAVGGHYGALLFASTASNEQGGAIESRMGPLIVLAVGPAERSALTVVSFVTERTIMSHLPAVFATRLQNSGLTPVAAKGSVTITNLFGTPSAVLDFNASGGHVLPQSRRQFQTAWQRQEVPAQTAEVVKEWKNFGFGYYTAWLTLEDGTGDVISAQTSFWIIPWQLIGLSVLFVLALFGFLRRQKSL